MSGLRWLRLFSVSVALAVFAAGAAGADPVVRAADGLQAAGVDVVGHGVLHGPSLAMSAPQIETAVPVQPSGSYTLLLPDGQFLLVEVASADQGEHVARFAARKGARVERTPKVVAEQVIPPVTSGWERLLLDVSHAHGRYEASGDGVTVAVVDTGVSAASDAMRNVDLQPGVSLPGVDPLEDGSWHGTPVAAIIAAATGTDGRAGIATGATIVSHRVFGADGQPTPRTAPTVIRAINHAVRNEADVINLSLSFDEVWTPLRDAVNNAFKNGTVVVAAAGNVGWSGPASADRWPAAYSTTIGVGATWERDGWTTRTSYTNQNSDVVLLYAPGTIFTFGPLDDPGQRVMHGTSMATPHVSAAVALARNIDPDVSPQDVMDMLVDTAFTIEGFYKHLHVGRFVAEAHRNLPHSFADTPPSNTHYESVRWATEQGITQGTTATQFRPYRQITRGELAEVLYRLAGTGSGMQQPERDVAAAPFVDVPSDHRFFPAISWAASTGVTVGHADGTFRPGDPVTRAAAATMLYRVAGEPEQPVQTVQFGDVSDRSSAAQPVSWGQTTGIISGYPDGTFRPWATTTRAAAMTLLKRAARDIVGDEDRTAAVAGRN